MAPKRNKTKGSKKKLSSVIANKDIISSATLSEIVIIDETQPAKIVCKNCSKSFATAKRMRIHQSNCLMNVNVKEEDIIISKNVEPIYPQVNKVSTIPFYIITSTYFIFFLL